MQSDERQSAYMKVTKHDIIYRSNIFVHTQYISAQSYMYTNSNTVYYKSALTQRQNVDGTLLLFLSQYWYLQHTYPDTEETYSLYLIGKGLNPSGI